MDDARTVLLSILASSLFLAALAAAADVEYIGPDQQHLLERQFDQASFKAEKDKKDLLSGKWSCDMYGVASHIQVQHKLPLYKFSKDETESFHNGGAQLVSDYKSEGGALIGVHERFEDQVRMTPDKQLISRLTVLTPKKMVVAYSVCKSL